ncbi:epithelial splicing regulatory protein 1-like isoform X3 [Salvia hispanica]|uniref:epithelial splicing regulatory protein 1-like isoform X3 n=1 Tax=Salvia hispanica TaxID=49212 RepID=UPI0020099EEE|nr:epithelial splicing regulatory protein 1-like isoform X3 [Salvia hispanica]
MKRMFYRGKYVDSADAREMGFKRQRLMDQGSSYFGAPGPSYMFTGEAYCVLGYPLQIDFALQRNRRNIGRRYVEVFRSRKEEYYNAIANEVSDAPGVSPRRGAPRARSMDERDLSEFKGVLRLRGLPFSATKDDIINFFKDFALSEDKVHLIANSEGRPAGESFVEFESPEESKAAMSKDRMTLGYRYIELFPASREELEEAASRGRLMSKSLEAKDTSEPTPVLRMRGLPFSAGKDDIIDFFKNFTLSEDSIHIAFNFEGRPTGEAFVEFASAEDAKAALAKDRMTLGSRYIELFQSSPDELNEAVSKAR